MKKFIFVLAMGLVLGMISTVSAAITPISYPTHNAGYQEPWMDVNDLAQLPPADLSVIDYLYGGVVNVTRIDDAFDQTWTFTGPNGTAVGVAKFADYSQDLFAEGYFSGIQFNILSVPAFGNGYAGLPPSATFSSANLGGDVFFKFRDDPNGLLDPTMFSSIPGENPAWPVPNNSGRDRMVTWRINTGPSAGHYVMGWEDGSDFDHNDIVYEFWGVDPHVVPEPTSMMLLGVGILGLLGLRRKA